MGNTLKPSTYARGIAAQERAQEALEAKGYRLLEANFRWKGGEIDLVMRGPARLISEIVFIEVRSSVQKSPWLRSSISGPKRRHLVSTAQNYFLRRPKTRGLPFRFDFVWIEGSRVEHWENVSLLK